MRVKNILFMLLFCLTAGMGMGADVTAAEKGQVSFTLSYEKGQMEEYKAGHPNDGEGAYVYVESIDDHTIYRFPLNASNSYGGTFDIPYGNYKVIADPEAETGTLTVAYSDVFAISDNTPIVEIVCNLRPKGEGKEDISATPSSVTEEKQPGGQPEEQEKAEETKEEESSRRGLSGQNIFTLIMIAAIFALWIYHRFIKYRRR